MICNFLFYFLLQKPIKIFTR